jgi:four helix bundle protein
MKIEKIQDFEVWKKAVAFSDAVSAILSRAPFVKDCQLREQIGDAIDSVTANMSEGFEQPTDRAFARFLYTSKGSAAEVSTRLTRAEGRGYLSREERARVVAQADEIGRMLAGLIKHLMKTPNRRRGLGRTSDERRTTND